MESVENHSLYQKSRTLTETDYRLLMHEAKRLNAQSVVEFGPGYSTFAWIEAGVPKIVGLEHDPYWFDAQKERFNDYPQVEIRKYWNKPEAHAEINPGETFDLAFVDSPKGYQAARVIHEGQEDCSRFNTLELGLNLAPIALLHDSARPLERGSLCRAQKLGHHVEHINGSDYGLARVARCLI